jgi:hypothetical protein
VQVLTPCSATNAGAGWGFSIRQLAATAKEQIRTDGMERRYL